MRDGCLWILTVLTIVGVGFLAMHLGSRNRLDSPILNGLQQVVVQETMASKQITRVQVLDACRGYLQRYRADELDEINDADIERLANVIERETGLELLDDLVQMIREAGKAPGPKEQEAQGNNNKDNNRSKTNIQNNHQPTT